MNKKQRICLVFGPLLCIFPVILVGAFLLDYFFFIANAIYSRYSPEAWFLTGMLALGIGLIIYGLDIEVKDR